MLKHLLGRVSVLAALALGLAAGPRTLGQSVTAAAPETRFAAIDRRLSEFVAQERIVGMSVGLIVEGKVAHQVHFGFEDREEKVAAGQKTMYRWASISKPLTAAGVMQLWEKGRLDLDADVRVLVPEFPDKGKTITMRQLLTHQGGIVHYTNGPVIKTPPPDGVENPFRDVIVALNTFKASPLVGEPGEKHSYTTHGYMLVGAVMERAGGAPYAEQIQSRIAGPLGLSSLRPDYQWEKIDHRAVGYRRAGDSVERSTDTDVSWKLAGGGWISTVGDLAGFGAAMLGESLIRPETRTLMWTRCATRDGKQTNYGLGFAIGEFDGKPAVAHSGAQEKAATYLFLLPQSRAGIALMCNTEGTTLSGIAREVAGMLAPPR